MAKRTRSELFDAIEDGARVSAVDAHGQTAIEYARDLLAEAAADAPGDRDVKRSLDGVLGQLLGDLERAGADLDAVVDDSGRTLGSLLESQVADTLGALPKFDFDAAVRTSMRLLESWSEPR